MEKSVMRAAMLISAAGAEVPSTAAVVQHSANLGLRQRTSNAVRTATDQPLEISVHCSSWGASYCCRPVDE